VLAVVRAAQFLTILDPWVVNIVLPVLQHDFCPCGAVGRLADPRCVRRPTRRAAAVREAGDPTARQDRGSHDVPKPALLCGQPVPQDHAIQGGIAFAVGSSA
jgi:hypothetical protein